MSSLRSLLSCVLFISFLLGRVAAAPQQPISARLDDLATVVRTADEIRILAPASQEILYVLNGSGIGEEFLRQFTLNEKAPHFHCMCLGDALLEFRTTGTAKATVGFHHARSIRWHDGPWTTDAELAGADGVKLSQWFQAKGFGGFEELRLESLRQMQEREQKAHQFSDQLPSEMKAVLFAEDAGFDTEYFYARRALDHSPDRPAWIVAAFRAFGQQPLEYRGFDAAMSLTSEFVHRADKADIAAALSLSKSDPMAVQGAAFFFARGELALPESEQELWWPVLADVVFQRGTDDLKQTALRRLIRSKVPATSELLAAIATGRVKYDYSAHLQGERKGEPDLVAAACLALAMKGDSQAASALAELEGRYDDGPSRAALELTRCLLRKDADFEVSSFNYFSFILGNAGLQALRNLPPEKIPASHIAAALNAPWGAVREDAEVFASEIGLARASDVKLPNNSHELDPPIRLARIDPTMAILVFSDMLPSARGETVRTLLEYRGKAFLNTGRNAEAAADFRAALKVKYDRQLVWLEATALWRSGDYQEALRLLKNATSLADHQPRETRGLVHFATEEMKDCEDDLAPIVALFPGDYRIATLHHMAACASGRPEFSQLSRSISAAESWEDKRFEAVLPRFWKNQMSEDQLLERARHPVGDSDESVMENEALTNFAISQKARLSKDNIKELAYLERVVALGQFGLSEHWLAHARLGNLQAIKLSPPLSPATDPDAR